MTDTPQSTPESHLPRRTVLATGAAGAAVAGALSVSGRRAARRWRALRQVDPALRRNPMVVLPLLPRHDLTVRPLQRLVSWVPFPTPEHAREETVPVYWSDNYVTLMPKERIELTVRFEGALWNKRVEISGKNVAAVMMKSSPALFRRT